MMIVLTHYHQQQQIILQQIIKRQTVHKDIAMQVTLPNFQLLHQHLLSILTTNNFENEHLPEKIMQYIGMIVESEKMTAQHAHEDFFDYFCEHSGSKIIKLVLEIDPMLSVKVLSMLFINLTSHEWISYLLCQPFINDAIEHHGEVPKHEEWPEYYISLLKSLSIRLNQEQLSLFYNKKVCRFPLVYEALKYYNHPDCMVRTNVMNIILGVMKIKDARLIKYFGSFPFLSYVLTYCCQVKDRITSLNNHLRQVSEGKVDLTDDKELSRHSSIIKSYYIDLIDYISYLNDLIELGPEQLSYFVQSCILTYILLPAIPLLSSSAPPLLASSTLLLIITLFKNISDDSFKEILCVLVMGRELPQYFIERIYGGSGPYVPKVYQQEFEPEKYYWDRFGYQVQKQCVKLFQDVKDFEIEHETTEEDEKKAAEFEQQINKISGTLGLGILTFGSFQESAPIRELVNILGLHNEDKSSQLKTSASLPQQKLKLVANPCYSQMLSLLAIACSSFANDSLLLSLCTVLNSLSKCEGISNQVLKYCGLLLPRLDTKNYKEQFNLSNMDRIGQIGLQFVDKINNSNSIRNEDDGNESDGVKVDHQLFSIQAIKNMCILFTESLHQPLSDDGHKTLAAFYRISILQLKQLITKQNMKYLVENFEIEYSKWSRQSCFHTATLTQTTLTPRKSVKDVSSDVQQKQHHSADSAEIDLGNRFYFRNKKQMVLYYTRKFILAQSFYYNYRMQFCDKKHEQHLKQNEENNENSMKSNEIQQIPSMTAKSKVKSIRESNHQKYTDIYADKYCRIEEQLKIGHSYEIGFKYMIECWSLEKKNQKNRKKLIIVEDSNNLVIVEPSSQENKAKIIVNHPWKYVIAEVDRETGKKMEIKLKQCFRSESSVILHFDDERRNTSTLQWMNKLKYERYQSEQAFILSYVKDCLYSCEKLQEIKHDAA